MGWKPKLLAALLGLIFLGSGLWPISVLCFGYILLAPGSRKAARESRDPPRRSLLPGRRLVSLGFFVMALLAVAAGGTLSPVLFLLIGAVVLAWPRLRFLLPIGETVPVDESILLRSRYIPFFWHAVAELKPGSDSFPRSACFLDGSLAVFTGTGRTYFLASCSALGRKEAESKLLHVFRSASSNGGPGAFLLPLDASSASEVFSFRFSPIRAKSELAPAGADLILLDCKSGVVGRAAAFAVNGRVDFPSLPSGTKELESAPLVWEVLEGLGKRTRWPDPDAFSNLLNSLVATKGVPLGERLKTLEGEGDELRVQSLTGEEIRISRPQMRAIISVYS
jgi:hypothetical protein